MNKKILRDLERVIDYLWEYEFNHWQESGEPENHIFQSINNVKNYLFSLKEGKQ